MQHEFGGNLPRPHLLIQTHFSSEEEYDIPGQFQFEAKDVISQASSYDIVQDNHQSGFFFNKISSQYIDALLTATEQLNNIIASSQINAMSQTFDILKSLKPAKLLSINHGRTVSKEIHHSKSVVALENQGSALKGLHKRKNTSTSQRDLARAQVLNQIIVKLHSIQRSEGQKSETKSQVHTRRSVQKKQLAKYQLKKLQNMMKEYKQVNQQSNKQSTVYYTKHYNKRKPSKNTFEESLGMEDSGSSSLKMSTFKKLKNDIMQVKNQVKQLKQINEIYRRENYNLKTQRSSHEFRRRSQGMNYNSHEKQHRKNNTQVENEWKQSPLFQPKQKNHPSSSQPYPGYYPPPIYHPNYYPCFQPQNYYPPQNYQYQCLNDFRKTNNHKRQLNRCGDSRHQRYWKTLVPQNLSASNSNHSHIESILFCFKCGYKCAQKNDRSSITEKKDYVSNPLHNFKNLL